ncbi:QRFP-like peptide receptor [Octopus bimaculoides]|uniref:G-protein coupled receptors family 1 profile domain-containing protein n=1 Tax=Octopus bimaculoides TaxID=37653 RepID=A0A0L8HMQ0_OCTBM|nr:QRFP-like peptide receptor [Octopus bimaculoides]XP_052827309.1 QRFP-like peptide receptor [Octopus bimaculoides]XP_052827310.1 QRFP-like peptide receptor [Octopus bimaculoides]XP_052827311.1 QRFP-like peptide receptor [Octopus bimaculoides]|eukprot:XP_014771366.1 PREDICTED: galanin receptor type 2-like [Octopus bimaculoides]
MASVSDIDEMMFDLYNGSLGNFTHVFEDYADDMAMLFDWNDIALVSLYTIVFVISIIGNISILLLIGLTRKLRNITNMLLSNMAVADLAVTVVCIPIAVSQSIYKVWMFGEAMCKFAGFLQGLAVVASIFTISILSLDRLLAIKYPMIFRRLCTTRIAVRLTIFIWLSSVCIMSPMLHVKKLTSFPIPNKTLYFCHEIWASLKQRILYDLCLFLIIYIFPGIITTTSYSLIGWRLLTEDSHLKRKDSSVSKGISNNVMSGRRRVAKMLIVLAALFLFCWSPYHIINVYLDFELTQSKNFTHILSYTILLGHFNSALNPILYFYGSKTFRRAALRIIRCQKVRSTLRGPVHVVVRYTKKNEGNIGIQQNPVVKVLSRSYSSSRSSSSFLYSRSSSIKSPTHRENMKELNSIQKRYDSVSWSKRPIWSNDDPIIDTKYACADYTHRSTAMCQRVIAKHRREILQHSLSIPTTINEESIRSCSCSPTMNAASNNASSEN